MWTVDDSIDNALRKLNFSSDIFCELGSSESNKVIKKAKYIFVANDPRVWWLSLKVPYTSISVEAFDNFNYILQNFPSKKCFFIPENEKECLRVFDGTISTIIELLGECVFFEYYIITKDYKILLIENDHNELLIVNAQ